MSTAEDDAPPFPVRLVDTRNRGRELVATAAIPSGGVVLRCLPLAVAPADAAVSSRCAACLSDAAASSPCAGGCVYRLCGACACDARWAAVHAAGECVSLRHLSALLAAPAAAAAAPQAKRRRGGVQQPPPADAARPADSAALRVLLRLCYVRALEHAADSALPDMPAECPFGEALCDDSDAADELVSHFDRLSDAQRAHAFGMADTARWCLLPFARRGREALARQAAALWCNSFDVVDAESGASLGEGLWPSAALGLNHSCEPNADFHAEPHNAGALAVRVLRDVAPGEVLTIAYCNLFSAKRRDHLRGTYFFTCRCGRCAARDAAPHVPLLAAAAAAALAAAEAGSGGWAAAAAAAEALEAAVAPLVAGGAAWARLTLARARWGRLRAAAALTPGSKQHRSTDAAALADELTLLLGAEHAFTQRVRTHARHANN